MGHLDKLIEDEEFAGKPPLPVKALGGQSPV